jgi:hypothetical protein
MSIPDSHTAVFTRIPESLEKRWSLKTRQCLDGALTDESKSKHCSAMVKFVSISVEFNTDLFNSIHELDENDDTNDELIQVWQSVRRDWAKLESAVNNAIREITEKQMSSAIENHMKSIDTLTKTQTIPRYCDPRVNPPSILKESRNYERPNRHQGSTISRVKTILPDESASVLQPDQMRQILNTMMSRNNQSNSGRRSEKRDKSRSFETVRRRRTD